MTHVFAGLSLAFALAPLVAQGPTWHTDIEKARAEARREGKPILAMFRCEP